MLGPLLKSIPQVCFFFFFLPIGHSPWVQKPFGRHHGYTASKACWGWSEFSPVLAASPLSASCIPPRPPYPAPPLPPLHTGLPTPLAENEGAASAVDCECVCWFSLSWALGSHLNFPETGLRTLDWLVPDALAGPALGERLQEWSTAWTARTKSESIFSQSWECHLDGPFQYRWQWGQMLSAGWTDFLSSHTGPCLNVPLVPPPSSF